MKITDVIRRPLITEKTSTLREDGRTIVFQVAAGATASFKKPPITGPVAAATFQVKP